MAAQSRPRHSGLAPRAPTTLSGPVPGTLGQDGAGVCSCGDGHRGESTGLSHAPGGSSVRGDALPGPGHTVTGSHKCPPCSVQRAGRAGGGGGGGNWRNHRKNWKSQMVCSTQKSSGRALSGAAAGDGHQVTGTAPSGEGHHAWREVPRRAGPGRGAGVQPKLPGPAGAGLGTSGRSLKNRGREGTARLRGNASWRPPPPASQRPQEGHARGSQQDRAPSARLHLKRLPGHEDTAQTCGLPRAAPPLGTQASLWGGGGAQAGVQRKATVAGPGAQRVRRNSSPDWPCGLSKPPVKPAGQSGPFWRAARGPGLTLHPQSTARHLGADPAWVPAVPRKALSKKRASDSQPR